MVVVLPAPLRQELQQFGARTIGDQFHFAALTAYAQSLFEIEFRRRLRCGNTIRSRSPRRR
jgi:hypothetical protein